MQREKESVIKNARISKISSGIALLPQAFQL